MVYPGEQSACCLFFGSDFFLFTIIFTIITVRKFSYRFRQADQRMLRDVFIDIDHILRRNIHISVNPAHQDICQAHGIVIGNPFCRQQTVLLMLSPENVLQWSRKSAAGRCWKMNSAPVYARHGCRILYFSESP